MLLLALAAQLVVQWGGVAVAPAATTAAFEFTRDNHYILDCEPDCPSPALQVAIGSPTGIATDVAGNVYFSSQNIVYRLDRRGMLWRVAGNGMPGFAGDGGLAVDALLNIPENYPEMDADPMDFYPFAGGLAVDAAGNLYIADVYNNRIRRVDRDGTITSVADAAGRAIDASWPQGIATDAAGNLYFSSQWGTVRRRGVDGTVVDLVGVHCGDGFAEGFGVCVPEQIALDSRGNLYVPDAYCRVRKWTPGVGLTTYAGNDRPMPTELIHCGYSGDDGPATSALLSYLPYGVAVDASDRLVIADTYNHCIRRVDAAGDIDTVAGTCNANRLPYWGINDPIDRRLRLPSGVAVDVDGNLYIADTGNRRIKKVAPDGTITTVAGNGLPLAP